MDMGTNSDYLTVQILTFGFCNQYRQCHCAVGARYLNAIRVNNFYVIVGQNFLCWCLEKTKVHVTAT